MENFDKVVITWPGQRLNARLIGSRNEKNSSVTYLFELLLKDFSRSRAGIKIMRITSNDLESKAIIIEKH